MIIYCIMIALAIFYKYGGDKNANKKTHHYSQKRGKVVEDEMRNASLMVSKT